MPAKGGIARVGSNARQLAEKKLDNRNRAIHHRCSNIEWLTVVPCPTRDLSPNSLHVEPLWLSLLRPVSVDFISGGKDDASANHSGS
jgi:hypothetical protein